MTTKIELNKMRDEAFKKLKTERMLFSADEVFDIVKIVHGGMYAMSPDYSSVVHQIERDIKLRYKKYDCIAMWLDCEDGLSAYEPELIKRIAIEIGGLKEVKV